MSSDNIDESLVSGVNPLDDVGIEPSEMDKVFKQMLDPNNLHHFTELNRQEIIGFSSLYAISELADKYKIDYSIIKSWCINNLKFRVSLNRKGKQEFVKITARSNGYTEQAPQQNGWNLFRR